MPELIDISHWQTVNSWPTVRDSGIAGVIVKATEANYFHDPMFAAHVAGAHSVGLPAGAYHFARPDPTVGDPVAEADYFSAAVGGTPLELIPMLDLEATSVATTALDDWVLAWCARVETNLGRRPGIYSAPGWDASHLEPNPALASYLLWVAHWGVATPTIPKPWTSFALWQYGGSGVPGIGGTVDRDRCDDLAPLLSGAAPPPLPPVSPQPTLLHGSTGANVVALQAYLDAILPGSLKLDGDFGSLTESAVRTFQSRHGLNPDGVVGPLTYSAISAHVPTPWAKSGATGAPVSAAQAKLAARGVNLKIDGIDGPATTIAVTTFQNAHGLTADGIVGPNTHGTLWTAA